MPEGEPAGTQSLEAESPGSASVDGFLRRNAVLVLLVIGVVVTGNIASYSEEGIFRNAKFRDEIGALGSLLFQYALQIVYFALRIQLCSPRGDDGAGSLVGLTSMLYRSPACVKLLTGAAVCYFLSNGLMRASLLFMDFALHMVANAGRVLFVMVGARLVLGKRYGLFDYGVAFTLVLGLSVFFLAERILGGREAEGEEHTASGHTYNSFVARLLGLALIAGGSLAAGLVGNLQQRTMSEYNLSPAQVLFCFSVIAAVYTLVSILLSGDVGCIVALFWSSSANVETRLVLFVFATVSILNTELVVTIVNTHGAVVAVLVTTLRKALSLVTSFLMYSKPFNVFHGIGASIVLGAILVHKLCRSRFEGASDVVAGAGPKPASGDAAAQSIEMVERGSAPVEEDVKVENLPLLAADDDGPGDTN